MKHHLVQCQHSHALYLVLTSTQQRTWHNRPSSRYANRKSYMTLNCRHTFQIWRITVIDKKVSLTKVEIIPLLVIRYFMLRPLVLVIRSFVVVSVSLFRLNSSRRGTFRFVIVFVLVWFSIWYRILVNAYFQAWSIFRLTQLFFSFLQPI